MELCRIMSSPVEPLSTENTALAWKVRGGWPSLGLCLVLGAGLIPARASTEPGKLETKLPVAEPPAGPAAGAGRVRVPPGRRGVPKDPEERIDPSPTPDYTDKRPPLDEIKPYANLRKADLSGMKLTGRNLRGIILVGANLRNTDFSHSDLTRANLTLAKAEGAIFTGTRVSMAKTLGASGLELDQARAHSLFHQDPDEVPGTLKTYALEDETFIPKKLMVGSRGDLFLMARDRSEFKVLRRTGILCDVPADPGPIRMMAAGPGKQLWCLHDGGITSLADDFAHVQAGRKARAVQLDSGRGSETFILTGAKGKVFNTPATGCNTALAMDGGSLWIAMPGRCRELFPDGTIVEHSTRDGQSAKNENPGFTGLAASSDGALVLGVDPGLDRIYRMVFENRKHQPTFMRLGRFTLPPGSAPRSIVRVRDGLYCYTAPGQNRIGFLDASALTSREFHLGGDREGLLGLDGLALGPDGNVWYTTANPGAIGCINEGGGRGFWLLDPGMVPEGIAAGTDGNLYFTLKDRAVIGSIRAFDPEPAAAAAPGEDKAPEAAAPIAAAAPAAEARPAAPPLEAEEERKAPAAPARARTVLEQIADLGVRMNQGDITHILDDHAFGADNTKGQFDQRHSTREAVPRLVLDGLRQAGALFRVRKHTDPDDRRHTPVRFDQPIGWYQVWGQWRETAWMDIVTQEVEQPDGTRTQVLKSAFPVSPHKYGPPPQ